MTDLGDFGVGRSGDGTNNDDNDGSQEDKMANYIMELYDEFDFEPEVHYNHYGSRGVVDLVGARTHEPTQSEAEEYMEGASMVDDLEIAKYLLRRRLIWIIEFKSDFAVASASGANEITRQFNSHREYFFKGSKYPQSEINNSAYFLLCFWLSESDYQHVSENYALYRSLHSVDGSGSPYSRVGFAHPKFGVASILALSYSPRDEKDGMFPYDEAKEMFREPTSSVYGPF